MVEDAERVLIRMNYDYGEQAKLGTHCKWPTSLQNTQNGSSFTTKTLHLEGQEVFRSRKQTFDIALGLKGDSHKYDNVNFF